VSHKRPNAIAFAFTVGLPLAAALAAQTPAKPQQPTFKAGVNFVRVDVYPSASGKIVPDLKQDEFDVLEDGVPQRIETFERVVIRTPGPESERAEPRSIAESNSAAAEARNRLFVLFLDSYHTTPDATTARTSAGTGYSRETNASNSRVGRALASYLQQLIGPDDLIALTRPEMPVEALTFTRRPSSFEDLLLTGGEWQRRPVADDLAWTGDLDETERRYQACYPGSDQSDIVAGMIGRRRERMVLDALRNLVRHLRGLREERKAILVVTEGWRLFTPDDTLARALRGGVPGAPPIGVVNGKPAIGDPRDASGAECDRDRSLLAHLDDAREFRDLLDEANRANASFYPIDPRGLPVFDSAVPMLNRSIGADISALHGRLDSLQTLAEATDGVAVINSNDFAKNLHRISDDLSSYYLLGYYSTNPKHDGKFRRITVRVKRAGVTVRARRGYLAATEEEVKANEAASLPPPDPRVLTLQSALDALDRGRPNPVLLLRGAFAWPARPTAQAANLPGSEAVLSVVVELDPVAARGPGWTEGGQLFASILDLDGRTLASGNGKISPTARTCLIRFADAPLPSGDYLARVKAQWSVLTTSEQVRIKVPDVSEAAASVLGQPIVFRRGPYAGPGFQPTADLRFRKAERIRLDVPLAAQVDSVAGQLLDRKGQPLRVPVTTGLREDAGQAFLTAEVVLAPLAPGDYVIEVSARRGERTDKVLTALRIVP
jgi:VWFA-related protein